MKTKKGYVRAEYVVKRYTATIRYKSAHGPLEYNDLHDVFLGATITSVVHYPKQKGDHP